MHFSLCFRDSISYDFSFDFSYDSAVLMILEQLFGRR
jgi:hypothetical protein